MRMMSVIERWLKSAFLLTVLSAFAAPLTYAAFEDGTTGARPAALGDAYQGILDDGQSLMYNPAGLAGVRHYELTTEYSKLYTGLTDGSNLSQFYLGYTHPLRNNGTLSIGWKQFSLDNLYQERTLSLGYGEWITSRIAWGAAIKQLYHSIASPGIIVDNAGNTQNGTPNFFIKNANAKAVYAGDLGVLVRANDRNTLSLAVQNFNQPNVALSGSDQDTVQATFRGGWSYKWSKVTTLSGAWTRQGSNSTYTGGAERWWNSTESGDFGLRGSLASGSNEYEAGAFGASYRLKTFQIDYAFVFNLKGLTPGASSTLGTHRFSITYAFGNPAPERKDLKPHKELTAEEKARQHRSIMDALFKNDVDSLDRPAKEAVAVSTPAAAEAQTVVTPVPEPMVTPVNPPHAEVAPTPLPAAPTPVAGEEQEEAHQTAVLMVSTPVITPEPVTPTPVPAAVIRTMPTNQTPAVQPSEITVPLRNTPAAPAPIVPLTRLELLVQIPTIIQTYNDLTAQKAAAEVRLAALAPIFDRLQGYLQGSGADLLDYMTREETLTNEAKDYAAMTWDGRSANERLAAIDRVLESHMTQVFNDRVWNKRDQRDARYKAWLDLSLAKARRMAAQKAPVPQRLAFWSQMAQKAHDFEMLPAEPILEAPAAPVASTETETAVDETPKAKAPAKTTTTRVPASAIVQTNADGTFVYKVQPGDTLINLAERFYGAYKTWRDIYYLNQDRLGRGGDLTPGQTLVMPKKDQ